MKKVFSLVLAMVMLCSSCAAIAEEINVISREDGSGTRGAFVELFGIEQKNEAGEKIDYTTDECDITNSDLSNKKYERTYTPFSFGM